MSAYPWTTPKTLRTELLCKTGKAISCRGIDQGLNGGTVERERLPEAVSFTRSTVPPFHRHGLPVVPPIRPRIDFSTFAASFAPPPRFSRPTTHDADCPRSLEPVARSRSTRAARANLQNLARAD